VIDARAIDLLEEAIEVSAGRAAPAATEAEYIRAALAFAQHTARPGESPSEALERLILSGSSVTWLLYEAASVAARDPRAPLTN